MEGKLRNICTNWLITCWVCSTFLWNTHVFLTLAVIHEHEWKKLILKFATAHTSFTASSQNSSSTATDLFANWIYFWSLGFLHSNVVGLLLACVCYCCCSWFYAVVQFLPDIWERWPIWVWVLKWNPAFPIEDRRQTRNDRPQCLGSFRAICSTCNLLHSTYKTQLLK